MLSVNKINAIAMGRIHTWNAVILLIDTAFYNSNFELFYVH